MKSQKVFWSSILLLAALGLGACAQVATQQKGTSPTAKTAEQEEQTEKFSDKG